MSGPSRSFADELSAPPPSLTPAEARQLAERLFGVAGEATPLARERDQNFRLTTVAGTSFVLKVANPAEDPAVAELQVAALLHVAAVDPTLPVPRVRRCVDGAPLATVTTALTSHSVRMVSFLDGVTKSAAELERPALGELGALAARLGRALRGFFHPAAGRRLLWDVRRAAELAPLLEHVPDDPRRALAARALERFRDRVEPGLAGLRAQVIHNDVQTDNVVASPDGRHMTGIIDFGDLVHAPLVCDLAVTTASLMFGQSDPLDAAAAGIAGYAAATPLEAQELELLPGLVAARLAAWVLIAAWRGRSHPGNLAYILHSVDEAWEALATLERVGHGETRRRFQEAAAPSAERAASDTPSLLARRARVLAPTFHLAYDRPLHLVRGEGAWLFDAAGRAYLDAYNNVPVVGHGHPRVVEALARQARLLSTNTRYLHEAAVTLAERLVATLPAGLDTCFFVNSGSEANDLAWRLAREATGHAGALVTAFAYHGVTIGAAELSPEEWPRDRRPAQVATLPAPDAYRGRYRPQPDDWTARSEALADDAIGALRGRGFAPAMVCLDAVFASDGIFGPPPGYWGGSVRATRAAGGLFVADEVQAGFGRSGAHFWGFAASGVVPDCVTLGKPMGNGHPVAAVVTRAAIAQAFAGRYPEFFSTFGGNTVSAVVALAVLDALQEEDLQRNAAVVGAFLRDELVGLARRHACVGDVRGAGLMLGVELVLDRETRQPAPAVAAAVVNALRERGVLVGRCGPERNVLKIRPPLVFSRADATLLLEALGATLATLPAASGAS